MLIVRPCTLEDAEAVDRLLTQDFYPEEPLTKANRITGSLPDMTRAILPQGHSLVAVSSRGDIVGVALNDQPPQEYPYIYTESSQDVKFQKMFAYMERVSGVLQAAPEALEVRLLAVSGEYRQRGVATALLEASKTSARRGSYRFLKVYCTSAHSSKLLSKLGWRLLYSLSYSDYLAGHPCDLVLPPEPHHTCDLFILPVAPQD